MKNESERELNDSKFRDSIFEFSNSFSHKTISQPIVFNKPLGNVSSTRWKRKFASTCLVLHQNSFLCFSRESINSARRTER